jgi:hypothetical protein
VTHKKHEPQKRPAYRKTDEQTFEKIRGQELVALEEMRERTARLRELRLKKETEERKANARKAARAGLSLSQWLEQEKGKS